MSLHSSVMARITQEEHERKLRYMRVILYTLITASIVLLQVTNPINQLVSVLMLGVAFGSLWFVHKRKITLTSYIIPTGLLFTFTIYIMNGRGMTDAAIYGYGIVILTAGLLLGKRGTMLYGFASFVSIWALYIGVSINLIQPPEDIAVYDFTSVTYISAYILIIISLLRVVITSLGESVVTARENEIALEKLNQELEGRVERRTKDLNIAREQAELLAKFGQRINATTTYTEILEAIVKETGQLDYTLTLNLFEKHDRDSATYLETVALMRPNQEKAEPSEIRTPLSYLSHISQILTHIPDINEESIHNRNLLGLLNQENIRCVLTYQFLLGERVIGTLAFYSSTVNRFTMKEEQLIQNLGELVASATERSRLYAEQVEVAEQLRTIDQMKSQFLGEYEPRITHTTKCYSQFH